MKRDEQHPSRNRSSRQCAVIAAALALFFVAGVTAAQAQSFQVLHTFTGGADGYYPESVVVDGAGNLYGNTAYGGNYESSCNYVGTPTGCGVVFKMTHHASGWIFNPLASFDGANGYNPLQAITVAPNGTLYSTTFEGGPGGPECHYFGPGCGVVYQLQPPASFCRSVSCPWTVTDIHQFVGGPGDGQFPELGSLNMDAAGNLYGTTLGGGEYEDGMLYELSPTRNGWTMSVLYNFGWAVTWGFGPEGGVVFDGYGNLYGVTERAENMALALYISCHPLPRAGTYTLSTASTKKQTAQPLSARRCWTQLEISTAQLSATALTTAEQFGS